jgi:CHAT domain-containing protein
MLLPDVKVALLYYFVGEKHLYAILASHDGALAKFRLCEWASIWPQIDALSAALQGEYSPAAARDMLHAFSHEWGVRLLPPASSLLCHDVLVIIPHHFLHGIPVHAIWFPEQKQFLATLLGVSYCSSATLLQRCMDRNRARTTDMSKWEFGTNDGLPSGAPASPAFCISLGADVIGEKSEQYQELAASFAQSFGEHYVFPIAARAFKNRLSGEKRAEAVCIVSHGYVDTDISDNSGLLLQADPIGFAERPIHFGPNRSYHFRDLPFRYLPPAIETTRLAELMTIGEMKVNAETDAELVALFACSSGAGEMLSGADFNTLAYQWLKTGASSVLANFWELDIDFARGWSPLFLQHWISRREPKAIAYQHAIAGMLSEDRELDPFQWATLSLFGDWL